MKITVPTYRPTSVAAPSAATYSLFPVTYTLNYAFSAKERDTETGLSYFGARYYSSDLSIWLSVDPMSDKYPSLSPYVYCADNPVKLVDPNGEEYWKPDEEGNLIAERGDNAWTLAKYLNIKPEKAISLLESQSYSISNHVLNLKEGDKFKLDNVFTRSIQAAKNGAIRTLSKAQYAEQICGLSEKQQKNWQGAWQEINNDIYNCWGAAISGAKNDEIVGGCGIGTAQEFIDELGKGFTPTNMEQAVFGQTIICFSNNGNVTHGAVYYGEDNAGNIYVYSKNGWIYAPCVTNIKTLNNYGPISGCYNLKQD